MEQKLNRFLHQQNLTILDGVYYHGKFFRKGVAQPPKSERPPQVVNPIFNMKGEIIFHEGKRA